MDQTRINTLKLISYFKGSFTNAFDRLKLNLKIQIKWNIFQDDATCTDAVVNDLSDVPFRFDLDDGSAKTTTGHDYKANFVVPSPDLDQPEPEIYLQESLQEHVTDQGTLLIKNLSMISNFFQFLVNV